MSTATAANGNRAVADEEQNAPVAILDHRLDQRARQVERTVKNHAPDQLPIRVGCFSERLVRPDRSIVDQDVDPAELGQRPGGQRLDLGLFTDVGEYRDRFDTKIPDLTRDGLSLLLIRWPVDHALRPFAGQLQHGRSTDIAPRSGDQSDLPFELAHALITPSKLASDAAGRPGALAKFSRIIAHKLRQQQRPGGEHVVVPVGHEGWSPWRARPGTIQKPDDRRYL